MTMRAWVRLAFSLGSLMLAVPGWAHDDVQAKLDTLAERAKPGVLGVEIVDTRTGQHWSTHAGQAYPMMSVFKAPLGATVLSQVDDGTLSLDRTTTIRRADLRSGRSPIRENFHGQAMTFTVKQLLEGAVGQSDNTAADALLRIVGGPQKVTAFLRRHDVTGLRVDRGEGQIAEDVAGLHGKKAMSDTAATQARRAGFQAYMRDPRDTSTPGAAIAFLDKLSKGELISAKSTRYLLSVMTGTPGLKIATGLPRGVTFAHKTGLSGTFEGVTAASNDIGIVHWPDGREVIVAAFLMRTPMNDSEQATLFAEIGKIIGDIR